jgi:RNA polymerase sigma-70 factor (ECF subfamily)
MDTDDLKLVRRARRGDKEAFRMLVERYKHRVYAIAYGMVRNRDTALDISQEAFLKVHRYLDTFQGNSSFYTWLYRLVVNLTIDHLRKEHRHESLDYDDTTLRREPDGAEAEIVPSGLRQNPAKTLERKEIAARLNQVIGSLSEKHRAVLLLREVEGLSYEEMARVLRIHKGTVMSRLFHARRYAQQALQQYLRERGEPIPEPKATEEAAVRADSATGA